MSSKGNLLSDILASHPVCRDGLSFSDVGYTLLSNASTVLGFLPNRPPIPFYSWPRIALTDNRYHSTHLLPAETWLAMTPQQLLGSFRGQIDWQDTCHCCRHVAWLFRLATMPCVVNVAASPCTSRSPMRHEASCSLNFSILPHLPKHPT